MSDVLVFPASRVKAVLLMLGSAAFVALGIWLKGEHPLVGWSSIIFFSLGIPAATFMLVPNAVYLRLDKQGFVMGSPFKKTKIRWSDVAGFELGSIKGAKMIAIIYRDDYKEQRLLRSAVAELSGMEGAIANNYTAPLSQVLASLLEWHARFGSGGA